mmetsp:Transcript_20486/g.34942  ORF Transcript_20486/g.34942 Transcript_20486/m.34942 type:complete len:86 (-) Transcript_20486:15-272(-)
MILQRRLQVEKFPLDSTSLPFTTKQCVPQSKAAYRSTYLPRQPPGQVCLYTLWLWMTPSIERYNGIPVLTAKLQTIRPSSWEAVQ